MACTGTALGRVVPTPRSCCPQPCLSLCTLLVGGTCIVLPALLPTAVSSPGTPTLRLVGAEGHCTGRVEVLHAGQWGSVCDDGWGLEDAAVVCQELGCGAALAAPRGAFFGEGTGPIWLDNVRCQGNESTLLQCPAAPWGITDCQHREDAAVVCAGTCSVCQACAVARLLGIVLTLLSCITQMS